MTCGEGEPVKRSFAALLVLMFVGHVSPARAAGPPEVSAACAVLMEGETGRVLFEKEAHRQGLIASTTKLMTALTALRSGHSLEETVEILPEYTGIEGSSIYLRPGERLRLETLLYGLLLCSGNDAAQAVAGFCAGDEQQFVREMNRLAEALGMEESHFTNPSGLDQKGHYSTAYDLALLARACLEEPTLKAMVSTRSITLEGRSFVNHNKLLWRYPGCVGMKTGYTKQAGRTLVSAAEREGVTLIAVTLNAPDDWRDHETLLNWGFANCRVETVLSAGQRVARLPTSNSLLPFTSAVAEEDLRAALLPGERAEYVLHLDSEALAAPAETGTAVGKAVCLIDGRTVGETAVRLCAAEDCRAPKRSLWERLKEIVGR